MIDIKKIRRKINGSDVKVIIQHEDKMIVIDNKNNRTVFMKNGKPQKINNKLYKPKKTKVMLMVKKVKKVKPKRCAFRIKKKGDPSRKCKMYINRDLDPKYCSKHYKKI